MTEMPLNPYCFLMAWTSKRPLILAIAYLFQMVKDKRSQRQQSKEPLICWLERSGQQTRLWHGLRSKLGINAGAAQKQQLLHAIPKNNQTKKNKQTNKQTNLWLIFTRIDCISKFSSKKSAGLVSFARMPPTLAAHKKTNSGFSAAKNPSQAT